MRMRSGTRLDDLTFLDADGQTVRLSALVSQPTLLIFLRHLA